MIEKSFVNFICYSFLQDLKNGANIIEGCCGTTPERIRKITEIVQKK